jgi:ferredoxin
MKFKVNENCIGCGLCSSTCPEVFSMSDDAVAVAVETEVSPDLEASAKEAQDNCPASAIESN